MNSKILATLAGVALSALASVLPVKSAQAFDRNDYYWQTRNRIERNRIEYARPRYWDNHRHDRWRDNRVYYFERNPWDRPPGRHYWNRPVRNSYWNYYGRGRPCR